MIGSLVARLRGAWKRRYYLWSRISRPQVPVHSLSWLPDGLTLQPVADTGITVADRFCAEHDSTGDSALVHRAAFLSGRKASCLRESTERKLTMNQPEVAIDVTADTEFLVAVFPEAAHARLVLVRDATEVLIEGLAGRAVGWPAQLKARLVLKTDHVAASCRIFEFSAATVRAADTNDEPRQVRTGRALTGEEELPDGVWAPGADHLEAVFGKPDMLTDLVGK